MKNLSMNGLIDLHGVAIWAFEPMSFAVNTRDFHSCIAAWAKACVFTKGFFLNFVFDLPKCKRKLQPSQHISPNFIYEKISNLSGNNRHEASFEGLVVGGFGSFRCLSPIASFINNIRFVNGGDGV